jgi:hypothetical protein
LINLVEEKGKGKGEKGKGTKDDEKKQVDEIFIASGFVFDNFINRLCKV